MPKSGNQNGYDQVTRQNKSRALVYRTACMPMYIHSYWNNRGCDYHGGACVSYSWEFGRGFCVDVIRPYSGGVMADAKESCETCVYCISGGCVRYPPKASDRVVNGMAVSQFPAIMFASTQYCGEYKMKDELRRPKQLGS